jgi:hypothetical protein
MWRRAPRFTRPRGIVFPASETGSPCVAAGDYIMATHHSYFPARGARRGRGAPTTKDARFAGGRLCRKNIDGREGEPATALRSNRGAHSCACGRNKNYVFGNDFHEPPRSNGFFGNHGAIPRALSARRSSLQHINRPNERSRSCVVRPGARIRRSGPGNRAGP